MNNCPIAFKLDTEMKNKKLRDIVDKHPNGVREDNSCVPNILWNAIYVWVILQLL